jgi:hypothetical protein
MHITFFYSFSLSIKLENLNLAERINPLRFLLLVEIMFLPFKEDYLYLRINEPAYPERLHTVTLMKNELDLRNSDSACLRS